MIPVTFSESNKMLRRPENMTDEECMPLPVYCDGHQCISCWRMTWRERFAALWRGKIWLSVLGGQTQPPVWVSVERTPFLKPKEE